MTRMDADEQAIQIRGQSVCGYPENAAREDARPPNSTSFHTKWCVPQGRGIHRRYVLTDWHTEA